MDVEAQKAAEMELDRLSTSKDPEVILHVTRAKEKMKARKWKEAQEALNAAITASYVPRPLMHVLVDQGKASSRAEARRLISKGAVLVDGKVCINPLKDCADAKEIKLR